MIQHIVVTVADFEAVITAIHVQFLKIQKVAIYKPFLQFRGNFQRL
jgi:hypothetical protein